jgi:hypothetical protein
MITVSINAPNLPEVRQKLRKLGQRAFMFNEAMDKIGDEVIAYLGGEVFASQGGVYGEPWAPLSEKYAIYKATGHTTTDRSKWRKTIAKAYPGAGIEIRTGEMKKGFYYESNSKSVMISNEKAEGEDPYLIYQQEGAPERGLPARPIIKVNDAIRIIIQDIISQDIKDKIESVGL